MYTRLAVQNRATAATAAGCHIATFGWCMGMTPEGSGSARLPRLTATELLRALQRDGWQVTRQRGSHMILRHPTKRGRVIVANHPGETIPLGTLRAILAQASLTTEELRALL